MSLMATDNGAHPRVRPIASATPWLGANFWSRTGGPRMWASYDGSVVREELAVLAEHGLNVTRSFCYWPDFVPEPETLDEEILTRFADFLDAHVERGARHDPDVHRRPHVGRELGSLVAPRTRSLPRRVARLAAGVVRRRDRRSASAGTRLWSAGSSRTRCRSTAASRRARRSRRGPGSSCRPSVSAGARQPISLGDGAWGVEMTGSDNGYSLRELAPLVDFVGPHVYPMQDDQVRQFLTAAFMCELAGSFGQPVVLEEFGVTSDFVSDENAAALLPPGPAHVAARGRDAGGSPGTTATTTTSAIRIRTGTTSSSSTSASPTATGGRSSSCGRSPSSRGSSASWRQRAGSRSRATRRSSCLSTSSACFRSRAPAYRQDIRDNLLQSYIAAREADLPVQLVRERDGIPGRRQPLPRPVREAAHGAWHRPAAGARPRRARRCTSRISPAARQISAARGSRGSTRSSASGTHSAMASSIRSRTTRSCSSSSRTSANRSRQRLSSGWPASPVRVLFFRSSWRVPM